MHGLRIVLASASPRRIELLRQVGIEPDVIVSDIKEEIFPGVKAENIVQQLAAQKALAVKKFVPAGIIIGSDTVVVKGERILGKPESPDHAIKMLESLSGTEHSVITGVALVEQPRGRIVVAYEKTKVIFKSLSQEEIMCYINSGEPFDKAGGYGIQGKGALLVEKIEGDYFNVVGLPLSRLNFMLKDWDVNLLLK